MNCTCCVYFDSQGSFCYYYKMNAYDVPDCTGYTCNCQECCKEGEGIK